MYSTHSAKCLLLLFFFFVSSCVFPCAHTQYLADCKCSALCAYMRNTVNYLCAQYHHFPVCNCERCVCGAVWCESGSVCAVLMVNLPGIETNEKWIFIQTIYKLHMLNLNEEVVPSSLPLIHLGRMHRIGPSHICVGPFISFFLWKMANLSYLLTLSVSHRLRSLRTDARDEKKKHTQIS